MNHELSPGDLSSPTWRKLTSRANERLWSAYRELATPSLPADRAEFLRGRIAELNLMLSLADASASGGSQAPLAFDDATVAIDGGLPP